MATKVPPLALDSTKDFSSLVPSAFEAANAAFIQANTATSDALISSSYANSAYTQANNALADAATADGNAATADDKAVTAGVYANSAFLHANAAFAAANSGGGGGSGIDTWVRDAANAASSYANSAYNQANTATTNASTADDKAVTAGVYANSAYTKANNALPLTGGTITGSLIVSQNTTIQGDLIVLGDTISVNTTTFTVQDTLLILGLGNYTTDVLDIGFASHYNDGSNAHTGLIRDAVTKEWILFDNYTPEVTPNNVIVISDPSFRYSNLVANTVKADVISNNIIVSGYNVFTYITNAYTQANTAATNALSAGLYANAAFAAANTGGIDTWVRDAANAASSYANSAYNQANTSSTDASSAGLYANSAFLHANAAFAAANSGGGGGGGGVTTFSAGITGFTPSTDTSGAIVLSGTLSVAAGGTGVTTSTGSGAVVLGTSPTISGPTINNGYTEQVFAISGATPALDDANGSIQTWTLPSNSTPTSALTTGQSITLMITAGAFTISWPSVTWKTGSGTAAALNTSGVTAVQLWNVGGVLYGARVGNN